MPFVGDYVKPMQAEAFQPAITPRIRMTLRTVASAVIATLCLSSGSGAVSPAQTASGNPNGVQKEASVITRASGTFDVKLNPLALHDTAQGGSLARMSLDKQFHGDLEGTSQGEMLSAGTEVKGSAGYVAIERVTGTLGGRLGSFVLQHSGTMTRGTPQLSVSVVPDSGTDQLVGLAGTMTITIIDKKHLYELSYTLAATP
jgi:hypothetical protein